MSRIRTVKPEFFTSEDIVALSPLARLLYVALWCEADKEGRLVWKPRTLKMRYLPGDDCEINDLCAEIVERGLVVLYGDGLAFIPSFKAHQHINPRERESVLPSPNEMETLTRQPRVSDASVTRREERKGKEGKDSVMSERGSDDAEALEVEKPKRPKPDYPADFLTFWAAYPTDPLMSKKEAATAWAKLSAPDRDLAQRGIAGLIEHQRKNPTYRMVHACRYLSQRRFEGLAPSSNVVPMAAPQFETEEEFERWWMARAKAGAA